MTQQDNPLTDKEWQNNIHLLNELGELRVKYASEVLLRAKFEEVNTLTIKLYEERVKQEQKNVELANRERDIAIKQAQISDELYQSCKQIKKGRGFWCTIKKLFSFWTARC